MAVGVPLIRGPEGGDPASVFFCHKAGLDYVSCSPFRVPIARLSAAQATLAMADKRSAKTVSRVVPFRAIPAKV